LAAANSFLCCLKGHHLLKLCLSGWSCRWCEMWLPFCSMGKGRSDRAALHKTTTPRKTTEQSMECLHRYYSQYKCLSASRRIPHIALISHDSRVLRRSQSRRVHELMKAKRRVAEKRLWSPPKRCGPTVAVCTAMKRSKNLT